MCSAGSRPGPPLSYHPCRNRRNRCSGVAIPVRNHALATDPSFAPPSKKVQRSCKVKAICYVPVLAVQADLNPEVEGRSVGAAESLMPGQVGCHHDSGCRQRKLCMPIDSVILTAAASNQFISVCTRV